MTAEKLVQAMNKNNQWPFLDFVVHSTLNLGRMHALWSENYDGGDFCQGLLFTYEGLKITE